MWLGLAVSALFVAFLIIRTDLDETRDALAGANYAYVAPTIALSFLSLWVRAWRWGFLFRHLTRAHPHSLLPLLTVGYALNNILPVRAGEFGRAYLAGGRYGVSRMAALGTVAVERAFDGIVLVGLLAIAGPMVGLNDTLRNMVALTALGFGSGVGLLLVIARSEQRAESVGGWIIGRFPKATRGSAREWWSSFLLGIRGLHSATTLSLVLGTTVLTWFVEAGAAYLMGRGFSIDEGFFVYLVVVAAANLAISVPSSQGGIGPYEFFAREVLVVAGVGTGVSTAYAIALHAVMLIPVTLAGLAIIAFTDISFRGALGKEPVMRDPGALPSDDPR